ncbi:MAG TPA: hypothetical protein VF849_00160 [Blattabacteriaceae bacterium]
MKIEKQLQIEKEFYKTYIDIKKYLEKRSLEEHRIEIRTKLYLLRNKILFKIL